MAGSNAPKGQVRRVAAAGVAAVMALTFTLVAGGVYRSISDAGDSPEAPPSANKAPPAPAAAVPAPVQAPAPAQRLAGTAPASVPPPPAQSVSALSQLDRYRVKRVLKIDGPLRHGDYVWDDRDVPDGPVFITVDMKAQTLSVFRAGYEIGVAVILYGATDKPTPLGVFPITEKDADHFSNLYDNAPMPYALRLTNDGVFIHGSDVKWGRATHGCIGVPTPFAKKLFGVAKIGDPVIMTDGKMMDLG